MTECGGRGTGQSSAGRSGLHTGFSISFFCTIVCKHSFFALLCFSLSFQLRPAAGVFLSRSSGTQSLSPRGAFRVFASHVCPNYVSSSFSLSPLTSSTPSSSSPAGSFPADVYLGSLLINLAEAKPGAASADAGEQPTVALSTFAPSSAATGRATPFEVASPSRAAAAAAAPYSLRWPVAAITAGASRHTVTGGGVAAATFCSSNSRPAEAVASFSNPPSRAAGAAAHSPTSECLYAGASAASSSRCGAAVAITSWSSTSHATGAPTCAAIGLRQLGQQKCCCSLHAALSIRRCALPSRQQPQELRCGFLSSLSRCSSPKCWTPQRRQQQLRWQAPAASRSYGSRALSDRKEKAAQQGGERRRNRGRNNSSSSYAAAAAAAASAVSAASARERRPDTALFDSQEERFSALKSLKEQETPKFQAEDWTAEMPLLEVKDLHVVAVEDGQEILKGVNLTVMPGEVHAIMGRNGSGKSTLSKVLAGYPSYKVTRGSVRYKGLDLLELAIDNRGLAGLFLAFQYPIEIPMVSNLEFLRVAFNQRRKWRGEEEVDSIEFRKFVEGKLHEVGLDASFLSRPLNYGFSGGEKKRNEILQMIVLDPELVMLDETDSGLDVDSFNVTAAAIKRFAARKNKSFLVTTHYKKLLDVLRPHKIHVMHAGRVILSGDLSLASRIEKEGFASLISDDPREEEEERRGLARGENLLENDDAYEPSSLSPSAAGGGRRDFDKLL